MAWSLAHSTAALRVGLDALRCFTSGLNYSAMLFVWFDLGMIEFPKHHRLLLKQIFSCCVCLVVKNKQMNNPFFSHYHPAIEPPQFYPEILSKQIYAPRGF